MGGKSPFHPFTKNGCLGYQVVMMLDSFVRFTLTFVGICIFLVFACWYFPENGCFGYQVLMIISNHTPWIEGIKHAAGCLNYDSCNMFTHTWNPEQPV